MSNISNALGGAFVRKTITELPAEQQLINAIESSGLDSPAEIIQDGNMHRFKASSRKDKSGYYVLYPEISKGICAGIFGDWRTGVEQKFLSKTDREVTSLEQMKISKKIEEAKKVRDIEKAKQYEVNANLVDQIWNNATVADSDHPYLVSKGIGSHGAKVTGDGRLVLPLYTEEGTLASLQYIGEQGKQFHAGGKTGGCFHMLGNSESSIIYITEGFADACTIVEETGCCCYIAYSGSNTISNSY